MEVTRIETFEAAHYLHDYEGPCANMHGHSYKVEVSVEGEPKANGMVTDFVKLKTEIRKLTTQLDHRVLNKEVAFFNGTPTTAENICLFFANELKKTLGDCVSKIRIWETAQSFATWRKGDDLIPVA